MIHEILYENILNSNDRIYDMTSIQEIIDQYNQKPKPLFGELFHPKDDLNISLAKVSHEIDDVFLEDGILKAEIKILNTTWCGKELKQLLENNMCVFSTRSIGSVDPITKKVTVEKFITVDAILFSDSTYKKYLLRRRKLKRILDV
ncbi:hypothetical protein M0Q97_11415 [Candidatus Dojkabacteria bacterium]|jgi:hypothetical protein|nr:hypothetical protein [Candidatus Dojkabacteria bacterium]